MTNKPDPRAQLALAEDLREQANAIEAEAIRDALAICDWLVKPAAALLGYPRHTSLVRLLETRHKAIGEELQHIRDGRTYKTGNPAPMRSK